MIEQPIVQLLILLLAAVLVVAVFQRLRIPSTLGYLLVGVVLGPYTPGPVIEAAMQLFKRVSGIQPCCSGAA